MCTWSNFMSKSKAQDCSKNKSGLESCPTDSCIFPFSSSLFCKEAESNYFLELKAECHCSSDYLQTGCSFLQSRSFSLPLKTSSSERTRAENVPGWYNFGCSSPSSQRESSDLSTKASLNRYTSAMMTAEGLLMWITFSVMESFIQPWAAAWATLFFFFTFWKLSPLN